MQRFQRTRDYDDEAEAGDGLGLVAADDPGRTQRRVERMLSARLREALKDTERLLRRLADVEARLAEVEGRLAGARATTADPQEPPPAPNGGDDLGGARLVAAGMVHAGYAEGDVEEYLREVYDIEDPATVVSEARSRPPG